MIGHLIKPSECRLDLCDRFGPREAHVDVYHLCQKEPPRHSNEVSLVQFVRGELEDMLDSAACAVSYYPVLSSTINCLCR